MINYQSLSQNQLAQAPANFTRTFARLAAGGIILALLTGCGIFELGRLDNSQQKCAEDSPNPVDVCMGWEPSQADAPLEPSQADAPLPTASMRGAGS